MYIYGNVITNTFAIYNQHMLIKKFRKENKHAKMTPKDLT